MSLTSIQDLLPLVQQPSRYLGCEINRFKKRWDQTLLHVALAFPDLYEIATSHFGIQILYAILNDQPDILAERVFAPAVDMEDQLRQNHIRLCSLESETPLKKFDIVGFSLLYELNYTNMVNMLDLAGIPFYGRQRTKDDPFVIAGGPCTCNPEPVADFFDAIVVGDGEVVIVQMTEAWKRWRQAGGKERNGLLEAWSRIKGVYIPSFFELSRDIDGNRRLVSLKKDRSHVERAVVADMNSAPFPAAPIIPFGKPVHDRLRMEIARGCTRGCRFCQAGMIYRPVRERRPESVLSTVRQSLKETGYEDLSLLSLSTGDYSCIAPLINDLMHSAATDRVAISLPSLRAGSLTPELMELIRKVRKTGFTIAPEAGSQRLRDVINKNITEAEIAETVQNAFSLGWKVIKLYFMIGLPTETPSDIEAIVSLVKRLKATTQKRGLNGKINVSVATFVPKPHTPFQWDPQIDLEAATEKINWLKDNLKLPGVQVKWQDPKVSAVEGIWARGDRNLSSVLIEAWKNGCRFDGWTDFFDYDRWMRVFEKNGVNTNSYKQDRSNPHAPLPWDHIHIGVSSSFLLKERERAEKGEITADCRTGPCSGCGVCDFTSLEPVSYHEHKPLFSADPQTVASQMVVAESPTRFFRYAVGFKKMGPARFLGHLEMVKLFIRALRRERLPLKYSSGFHPMARVSFVDTLPVGMQSEDEWMLITLIHAMEPEELVLRLHRQMPQGLEVVDCQPRDRQAVRESEKERRYRIELKDGFFRQNDLDWFSVQQIVNIEIKGKAGRTVALDLKKIVVDLTLESDRLAMIRLGMAGNRTIRPARVIKTVFQLTDRQIATAIVTKLKADHV
ncbi:MAG: TIGR03960 family B12-binding radical SAM protein [Desulfosarcina sp.]